MELTQVARRILLQHWRLIAVSVLIPVLAVAAIESGRASTYTASARLALDAPDPTTRQQAAAVGDTAKALATSPGRVAYALKQAKITGRDPNQVASNNVDVSSLGSSGLVQLSVTDRNPRVAASIANSLARTIIQTRVSINDREGVLADLATRIGDLQKKISAADTAIAAINAQIASGQEALTSRLRARVDALAQARDGLKSQQDALQSERSSLVTALSTRPRAEVVSAATPPSKADPSNLPTQLVLALLLGLVAGVAVAALIETARPTVIGSAAVAQEFDAPLLGTLRSTPDDEVALGGLRTLQTRLSLAAGAAVVPSVALVTTSPSVDLRPLAARLDGLTCQRVASVSTPVVAGPQHAAASAVAVEAEEQPRQARQRRSAAIRVVASPPGGAPSLNGRGLGGVVVVAPSALRLAEVEETQNLLRIMPVALFGVVTYPPPKPRRRRRTRLGRQNVPIMRHTRKKAQV